MAGKIWTFEEAALHLRQGGIGVYPTETFMALGCRVHDNEAVRRVYEAKRRPHCLPLPVIAGDREQVESVVRVPPEAEELIRLFWPGPLSILLPVLPRVPRAVSGGTGYAAVRISPHPGARALALAVGEALVGSSANISGADPPADAADVSPFLLERVDGMWEQPPRPEGGLPSTLVRISAPGELCIVRPGIIRENSLRKAGFHVDTAPERDQCAPGAARRSPAFRR